MERCWLAFAQCMHSFEELMGLYLLSIDLGSKPPRRRDLLFT